MNRDLNDEEVKALADFVSYYRSEAGMPPIDGQPAGTGLPLARMIAAQVRKQRESGK